MSKKILRSLYCLAIMFLSAGAFCLMGANKASKVTATNGEVSSSTEFVVGEGGSKSETTIDHFQSVDDEGKSTWFADIKKGIENGDTSIVGAIGETTVHGETFYTINNATDLATLAYQVVTNSVPEARSRKYILTANIALGDKLWTAIGTPTYPFTGEFYGAGYTISGIKTTDVASPLSGGKYYSGLFGYTSGAKLVNITVSSYQHSATHTDYCGALLAYGAANTVIIDCKDTRSNISSGPCYAIGYLDSTAAVYNGSTTALTVENPAGKADGRSVVLNPNGGTIYKWSGSASTAFDTANKVYALYSGTATDAPVSTVESTFVVKSLPWLRATSMASTTASTYIMKKGSKGSWPALTTTTFTLIATWTETAVPVTIDYGYGSTENDGLGQRVVTYNSVPNYDFTFQEACNNYSKTRIGYTFQGLFKTSNLSDASNRIDESTTLYIGDSIETGSPATTSNTSYNLYAKFTVSDTTHSFTLKPVMLEGEDENKLSTAFDTSEGALSSISGGVSFLTGIMEGDAQNHTPDTEVTYKFSLAYGYTLNTVAVRTAGQTTASSNTAYDPAGYVATENTQGGVRKVVTYPTEANYSLPTFTPAANYNDPYKKIAIEVSDENVLDGNQNSHHVYTVTIKNMVAQAEFYIVIAREEMAISLNNVQGTLGLAGAEAAYTGLSVTTAEKNATLYTRIGEDFVLTATASGSYYYMYPPTDNAIAGITYVGSEGELVAFNYVKKIVATASSIAPTKANVEEKGRMIDLYAATLNVFVNLNDPIYPNPEIDGASHVIMGVIDGNDVSNTDKATLPESPLQASISRGDVVVDGTTISTLGFRVQYDVTNPYYTFSALTLNDENLAYVVDSTTGRIFIYNKNYVNASSTDELDPPFVLGSRYNVGFTFVAQEYTVKVNLQIDGKDVSNLETYFDITSTVEGQTNMLKKLADGSIVIENVYALSDNYIRVALTDLAKRHLVYDATTGTKALGGASVSNAGVTDGVYTAMVKVGAVGVNQEQSVTINFESKVVTFKFTEDAKTPAGAKLGTIGGADIARAIMPIASGSATSSVTAGLDVDNGTFGFTSSDISGVNIISGYYFLDWYVSNGKIVKITEGNSYSIAGALTNDDVLAMVEAGGKEVTINVVATVQAKTITITFDGAKAEGYEHELIARMVGNEEAKTPDFVNITDTLVYTHGTTTSMNFGDRGFVKVASVWDTWSVEPDTYQVENKNSTEATFTATELVDIWGETGATTYDADSTTYYTDKNQDGTITFIPQFTAREIKVAVYSADETNSTRVGTLTVKLGSTITLTAEGNVNEGYFASSYTPDESARVNATIPYGLHAVSFAFDGKTGEYAVNAETKQAVYSIEEATIKSLLNESYWFASATGDATELAVSAKTASNIYTVTINAQGVANGDDTIYPEKLSWLYEGAQTTGTVFTFDIPFQANIGAYLNSENVKFKMERDGYVLKSLVNAVDSTDTSIYALYGADGNWSTDEAYNYNAYVNKTLKAVWELAPNKYININIEELTPYYNGAQQDVATATLSADGNPVLLGSVLDNGEQVVAYSWNKTGGSTNANILQGINVNEFENEDNSFKSYTFTITVEDKLTGTRYTITKDTTTAKIQRNTAAVTTSDNLWSYYSGTSKFYEVADHNTKGDIVYTDAANLNVKVSGISDIAITLVDSNDRHFRADSENKYTAIYTFTVADEIAANFVQSETNFHRESANRYSIVVSDAVTIVPTPLVVTVYGTGLYVDDLTKHNPTYTVAVDPALGEEYAEIFDKMTFTFTGKLETANGEQGEHAASTMTWIENPLIKKGEEDVTASFSPITLAGTYTISSDNIYVLDFDAKSVKADAQGILYAEAYETAKISVKDIEISKNTEVVEEITPSMIQGSLYTYYDEDGNAIFTVTGNGTAHLVVRVIKSLTINETSNSYSVKLRVQTSAGANGYKFNGFYGAFEIVDFPTNTENANVVAVVNGVQAGTQTEATLEKEFTDTEKNTLVYTNVKPIEFVRYNGTPDKRYMSVGTPFEYTPNPSEQGFVFDGWAGDLTGVAVNVDKAADKTTVTVDETATLGVERLVSTWTLAKPTVNTVTNVINRDTDVAGFSLSRTSLFTLANPSNDITYVYSWYKKGETSADDELIEEDSETHAFEGKYSDRGTYYIVVKATRAGYTDATSEPFEFTINMSKVAVTTTADDQTAEYANADLTSGFKATITTERVNDESKNTSNEVSIASYLTTKTKSYFFTIVKKGVTSADDAEVSAIRDAGEYTVTLGFDEEYFTGTKNSFNVTVSKYTYPITKTDVEDLHKMFGQPDPEAGLNVTLTLLNGERVTVPLTRAEGEDVKSYALSVKEGYSHKNYNFTVNADAVFVIEPVQSTLVVEVVNSSVFNKTYNTEETTIEAVPTTTEGRTSWELVAKEGTTVIARSAINLTLRNPDSTVSQINTEEARLNAFFGIEFTVEGNGRNAGSHKISIVPGANANYKNAEFTDADFAFSVEQATYTIKASDVAKFNKNYGVSDIVLSTNITTEQGETFEVSFTREVGEDVGSYAYLTTVATEDVYNTNYKFENTQSLVISKQGALTVSVEDASVFTKAYNNKTATLDVEEITEGGVITGYNLVVSDGVNTYSSKLNLTIGGVAISELALKNPFRDVVFSIANDGKNVGSHALSMTLASDKGNYTGIAFAGVNFIVTQATYTVKASDVEGFNKFYGEADKTLTTNITTAEGETFEVRFTREAGEDVGSYAYLTTVATEDIYNTNYKFENTQQFVISAEGDLVVTVANPDVFTKEFNNQATTFTTQKVMNGDIVTGYNLVASDDENTCSSAITLTVNGKVVDGHRALQNAFRGVTYSIADEGKNVGTHAMSMTMTNGNYTGITFQGVSFEVTAKTLTIDQTTLDAQNISKVYGAADVDLSVTLTPYTGVDVVVELARKDKNAGTDVGEYELEITNAEENPNYDIQVTGKFKINQAEELVLTIADETILSRVYNGSASTISVNAADKTLVIDGISVNLTLSAVSGSSLVSALNGVSITFASTSKDVGTYDLVAEISNGNYKKVSFAKAYAYTISQYIYSITAKDLEDNHIWKFFGQPDPVMSFEKAIADTGEKITITLKRGEADKDATAIGDEYSLEFVSVSDSKNYNIVLEGLYFEIRQTEATLVITVDTPENFKKTFNKLSTTIEAVAVETSEVITGWKLVAKNSDGTVIGESTLTLQLLTLDGEESNYTNLNPTEIEGAKLNTVQFVIDDNGLNAGSHSVSLDIGTETQYKRITFASALNMVVDKFAHDISLAELKEQGLEKTYGDDEPTLKLSYSLALVEGVYKLIKATSEDVADVVVTLTRDAGKDAGDYAITIVENYNSNYKFDKTSDAVFKIHQADELVITIDNTAILTKDYDGKVTTLSIVENEAGNGYVLVASQVGGSELGRSALTLNVTTTDAIANALNTASGKLSIAIIEASKDVKENGYNLEFVGTSKNFKTVSFGANYAYTINQLAYTIKQSDLSEQGVEKFYGVEGAEKLTLTYTLVEGETVTVDLSRANKSEEVGAYPVEITAESIARNTNYNFSLAEGVTFNIKKNSNLGLVISVSVEEANKLTKVYNKLNTTIKVVGDGTTENPYKLAAFNVDGETETLIANAQALITLSGRDLTNDNAVEISDTAKANAFNGVTFSLVADNKNVGSYTISVDYSGAKNFAEVIIDPALKFNVTPASYTIDADDVVSLNKFYGVEGAENLTTTVTTDLGETLTVTFTRASGEDKGTYALTLTQESIDANKNYTLNVDAGAVFTINQVNQAIQITIPKAFTKKYNAKSVEFVLSKSTSEGRTAWILTAYDVKDGVRTPIEGASTEVTLSLESGTLTETAIANALKDVAFTLQESTALNKGTYTIVATADAETSNYATATVISGDKFTITEYTYTISYSDLQLQGIWKYFGDTKPEKLTLTYTTLVEGETVTVELERENKSEEVGKYDLKVNEIKSNGSVTTNYIFTLADNAKFDIKQAEGILRIILQNPEVFTKEYNGLNTSIKAEFDEANKVWKLRAYDKSADGETETAIAGAESTFKIYLTKANEEPSTENEITYENKEAEYRNALNEVRFYLELKATPNVGSYNIMREVTGSSYSEVMFGEARFFTITPRPLSITSAQKEYDGNVNISSENGAIVFTNYVAGEEDGIVISGTFDNANVGEDKTVELTLSGTKSSNYTLASETYAKGIIKKSTAIIGVTLPDLKAQTYGTLKAGMTDAEIRAIVGNPAITINGSAYDTALNLISAELKFVDLLASESSTAGFLTKGDHTLTVILTSDSYEITESYTFTVNIEAMEIDFSDISFDKDYDENVNLPFTDVTIDSTKIKTGDLVTATAAGGFDSAKPGAELTDATKITLSGDDAANYKPVGTLEGTINRVNLTLTVDKESGFNFVKDGGVISIVDSEYTVSYPRDNSTTTAQALLDSFKLPTRNLGYRATAWMYEDESGSRIVITEANIDEALKTMFHSDRKGTLYVKWEIRKFNVTFTGMSNIQSIKDITKTDAVTTTTDSVVIEVEYYSDLELAVIAKLGYKFTNARITSGTVNNGLEVTASGERSNGRFTLGQIVSNATVALETDTIKLTVNIDENASEHKYATRLENEWNAILREVPYVSWTSGALWSDTESKLLPTLSLEAGTYTFTKWTYEVGTKKGDVDLGMTIDALFRATSESEVELEDDAEITFTAHWTGVEYTISFDANGGQFVGATPDPFTVTFGQALSTSGITALPEVEMAGQSYTWNSSASGNGLTYEVDDEWQTIGTEVAEGKFAHTLYAKYAPKAAQLTVNIVGADNFSTILHGNTPVTTGYTSDIMFGGTPFVLSIKPEAGFSFTAVLKGQDGVELVEGEADLTVSTSQVTVANLVKPASLTITAVANPASITAILTNATLDVDSIKINGAANKNAYKDGVINAVTGDEVEFVVLANAGWSFVEGVSTYSISGSEYGSTFTVVDGSLKVVWKGFTDNATLTASATANDNIITVKDSSAVVSSLTINEQAIAVDGTGTSTHKTGSIVTVKATLKYGYFYANIADIDGVTITPVAEDKDENTKLYTAVFTFQDFTDGFEFEITAIPRTYSLSISSNDEEKGTVSPATANPRFGQTVTLTATPNTAAGNEFVGWYIGDARIPSKAITIDGNSYKLSINESLRDLLESQGGNNVAIVGRFGLAQKEITLSVGEFGNISYVLGENESVTITSETPENQRTFNARYDTTLTIKLNPIAHYEVDKITYRSIDGDVMIENGWYNAETNTITFVVSSESPSSVDVTYKPSRAIVNVDARVEVNHQYTYGSDIGGTIVLTDRDGNPIREGIFNETVAGATYKVDTVTNNVLYFVAKANKGYTMSVTSPSEGVVINYSYTNNNELLCTVLNVYEGVQIYATFIADVNTINIQFVDSEGNNISAGKIAVTESATVVANGNYSSFVNVSAITGVTSQIRITANVGLSFTFVSDGEGESRKPEMEIEGLDVVKDVINPEDRVATGFSESSDIIIRDINSDGTIKIKVKPKEYNVVFVSDGREIAGSRITGVTYGSELNIESVRNAISITKPRNVLLGYYTYELGQGVRYLDRDLNVTRAWSEEGYKWNGSNFVPSENFIEETDTFRLYASWLYEKESFTVDFIPDALKGVKQDLNVTDVFANLDPNTSWTSANNLLYAEVQSGVALTLRAYDFEGYTFARWEIERTDLQGNVQLLNSTQKEYPLTAINGNTKIKAVYYADFELAIGEGDGGRAYLVQENVSLGAIGSFDTSKDVTIVAQAYDGYTFIGWYDKQGNLVIPANETRFDGTVKTYTYEYGVTESAIYLEARFEGDTVGAIFNLEGLGDHVRNIEATLNNGDFIDDLETEFEVKVGQTIKVTVEMNFGYGVSWDGNAKFTNVESTYNELTRTTTYKFEYKVQAADLERVTASAHGLIVYLLPVANPNNIVYSFSLGIVDVTDPDKDVSAEVASAGSITYTASGRTTTITNGVKIGQNNDIFFGNVVALDYRPSTSYEIDINSASVILTINGRDYDVTSRALVVEERRIYLRSNFLEEFEARGEVNVTIKFKRLYWTAVASETFAGNGSESDPYIIANAQDLALLASLVNTGKSNADGLKYADAYYKLTADIDLNGRFWQPIGNSRENSFNGTIDLGEFEIANPDVGTFDDFSAHPLKLGGVFWYCTDSARFLQANNNLVLALSIVGGVIGLILIILLIILLERRRRKKRMEQLANG